MSIEHEYKFFGCNTTDVKKRLIDCGFRNTGVFLYRTLIFSLGDSSLHVIRLRDQGSCTTFTIKEKDKSGFNKETEIKVSDFNKTRQILIKMGLRERLYSEKIRDIWTHSNQCEVVFDTLPIGLTYIEVECPNLKMLYTTTRSLQLAQYRIEGHKSFLMAIAGYLDYFGVERTKALTEESRFTHVLALLQRAATRNREELKKHIARVTKMYKKAIRQHKPQSEARARNINK